ncbi:MAG: DUF4190 domain-containing protein [Phycisphaerales bacterium]
MNPYAPESATTEPVDPASLRVNCISCGADVSQIPLGSGCGVCGAPVAASIRSRRVLDPGHGLALASTISSAVGIGACAIGLPVGLTLGIIALRKYTRDGGSDSTRILAKIGIWIGGIGTVVIGGIIVFVFVAATVAAVNAPVQAPNPNMAPPAGLGGPLGPGGGLGMPNGAFPGEAGSAGGLQTPANPGDFESSESLESPEFPGLDGDQDADEPRPPGWDDVPDGEPDPEFDTDPPNDR